MYEQLVAAVDQIETIVGSLEPDCLDAKLAVRLVELFGRGERLCSAGKTLAVARVDSSGAWSAGGDKGCAAWLARKTGTSLGEAIGVVDTARRLPGLPATDTALRKGKLSPAQAKTVADAASTSPSSEQSLLDSAARNGLAGLKRDAVKVKAGAEDDRARAERQRRQRSVRVWTDDDGMGCGGWRLAPDEHARVVARLKAETDRVFNNARKLDIRDTHENYAADAFVNLICGAQEGGTETGTPRRDPDIDFSVHISWESLLRGETREGESCEIPGIGPISVARARQYLLGGAFLKILISKGVDIRTVCHYGRHIPAELRTAIEWRDQECTTAGCHRRDRLEIHHIEDHAKQGPTALYNLCTLCKHDHDLVTHHGYSLSEPNEHGKRRLIAPKPEPPPDDS